MHQREATRVAALEAVEAAAVVASVGVVRADGGGDGGGVRRQGREVA